jgi:hypothetical protein
MTAQISETLIVDGEPLRMAFCPPLPPDSAKWLIEVEHEHVNKPGPDGADDYRCVARWRDRNGVDHEEEEPDVLRSTACWRRYQGAWEIVNGALYLVALRGDLRLASDEPLLADWFTGMLRVPRGDQLMYVHMGFGTVYEEEVHIRIERGEVRGQRIYDNRGEEYQHDLLTVLNLPGLENYFPGCRDFD